MFEHDSRYYELADRSHEDSEGRAIVYKERRFLPKTDGRPALLEVEVGQSERPDLLAARTLNDPELFWQLCEANGVMHPLELTARSGRRIRVLLPGI